VASRETQGGAARVKAARFPQVKTMDDFDFSFQRSVKRQAISHLAQLD
jgi:DNA replication protein DnaC